MSGGTPHANFKDLAHAWGREKGFHHVLTTLVCERRGEVERKRRSDVGRQMSEQEKAAFKEKLHKKRGGGSGDDVDTTAEEAAAEAVAEVKAASKADGKEDEDKDGSNYAYV